jgi:hypothetical protein
MAVALSLWYTGVTPRMYDRLMAEFDLDVSPPVGEILHVAAEGSDGMEVVEVWQTREAAESFVRDVLAPRLAALGAGVQLEYMIRPLHNLFAPDLDTIERIGAVSLPGMAAGAVRHL